MNSFIDSLTKWQPFFTAVCGVAATLAGLLFVSLSINRDHITATQNRTLLRLARRSFGDLLYTLFIALMFLMPTWLPHSLAIPLICFSIVRGCYLTYSIHRCWKTDSEHLTKLAAWRDYSFQAITGLGLLFAAIEIYQSKTDAIFLLVPIVSFLLYNASINAWSLLMMEKKSEKKSSSVD